jgi:hypothetical protein
MIKNHPFLPGAIILAATLLGGVGRATAPVDVSVTAPTATVLTNPAVEELFNNGEDFTRPIDRFDTRFQFQALPDATEAGKLFGGRHAETMTFRTDLVFFPKPDQLALRVDLPMEWSNKPTSGNPHGVNQFGLGDMLVQAAYIHTFNTRWAAGAGLQMILPTATDLADGNGKWQFAPTLGVRASLPEISEGSYAGLILRNFTSVEGPSSRANIDYLSIEPQVNINLPDQWFVITDPKIRYNWQSNKWFVPLDIMVGKKFGVHWIVSVEYQYGLVREDDRYHEWVEARVGYFF